MLPKRDPNQTKDSQQLQLNQAESVAKKRSQKQTILLLTIGLTIGLSLVFSLYHFFSISPPTFKLPHFKLPNLSLPPSTPDLSQKLSLYLNDSATSLYVQTIPNTFSWVHPPGHSPSSTAIDPLVVTLSSLQNSTLEGLPPGCQVQQQQVDTQLRILISVPQKQILILINSPPPQPRLSSLISDIYWQAINL